MPLPPPCSSSPHSSWSDWSPRDCDYGQTSRELRTTWAVWSFRNARITSTLPSALLNLSLRPFFPWTSTFRSLLSSKCLWFLYRYVRSITAESVTRSTVLALQSICVFSIRLQPRCWCQCLKLIDWGAFQSKPTNKRLLPLDAHLLLHLLRSFVQINTCAPTYTFFDCSKL